MEKVLTRLNERDLRNITFASQSEIGESLFRVISLILEDKRETFDMNAKICNDPLRQDFRVKMGEIIGMGEVLTLPRKCQKQLENNERRSQK